MANGTSADQAMSLAALDDLAQHPQWLRLLHYERRLDLPFGIGGYRSAITSKAFFLSDDGSTDAAAELRSTLAAFALPVGDNADDHALCKFPARYQWLKSQGATTKGGLPQVRCQALKAWKGNQDIESVSLVFVTGYLGNPASYYGHVLLKFNAAAIEQRPLLDLTMNYGAIIPDNENPFRYIVKGIFGGYSGGFTDNNYYYHNHQYGEQELRNLWEYELNLSQQQTNLVVAHSWELIGKKHQYFFFDRNCAYRMAKILEIATNRELTSTTPLISFPQSLTRQLAGLTANNQPVVKKVLLHRSRQGRLYSRYNALTGREKTAFLETARDIKNLDSVAFKSMNVSEKQRVVETLLDYNQFTRSRAASKTPAGLVSDDYRRLLATRFALPAAAPGKHEPPSSFPHQGRKPSMLQIGAIHHQQKGTGLNLTLRPAYYDPLDAGPAHIDHSALGMGEIELESFNGRLALRRVELVKITSVGQAVTGLPEDQGKVWHLRAGVERQTLDCNDCLSGFMEASAGRAIKISSKVLLGGFAGGRLMDNRNDSGNAQLSVGGFAHWHISGKTRVAAETELPLPIDSARSHEIKLRLTARWELTTNVDLRLDYRKHGAEELGVKLGVYF